MRPAEHRRALRPRLPTTRIETRAVASVPVHRIQLVQVNSELLHFDAAMKPTILSNTTVTHLQLAGNNIGAMGAVYLKTVLTLNQNITYMDLSKNDPCRDASSSLALGDALRVNAGLRSLLLSRNNLRDQDAVHLAAGIQANSD